MFVHLQNFQHVSDQTTNPLIWFPSKFLSLSSTLLTRCYVCSSRWSDCTSFFLRAVNIFPSVIVADKFSGNILFFQFKPDTDERCRLRTNIFPRETQYVYVRK